MDGSSSCSNANASGHSGKIKFENERCNCRRRVVVRISELAANPNRLYFTCPNEDDNKKCGYFRFWSSSKSTDLSSITYKESDQMQKVFEEHFRNIKGKVEKLIQVISSNENKIHKIIQQQKSIFRFIGAGEEANKMYTVATVVFCFLSIVLS